MPTPTIKEFDPELHQKAQEYRRRHDGLSLKDFSRRTGLETTQLSRYMSGNPVGDVRKIETVLADVIHTDENLRVKPSEIFETTVTRQFRAHTANIRSDRDIGLLYAPAGIGKTCAITRFCSEFPVAVAITLNIRQRDPRGIEAAIMEKIDTHQWRRSVSRWEFLRKHFNQSDRPIIIDNAHRLTSHGRCWIFDFHDVTDTPFVLVGNPEILDDIARDRGEDQQSTRIGICPELGFNKSTQLADAVNKTLSHRLPQKGFSRLADSIRPLALQVAKRKGHLRALNKQLNVALELFEKQKFPTLKDSFMAAHELLIRDYALEA